MQGIDYWSMCPQKVKVTQSCPTLWDPMDCSPPRSSVHGILQARIPEWVAIPFFRDFPDPEIKPGFSVLAGGFFITELPRKPSQMEHRVTDFSLSGTNTSKC